MDTSSSTFTNYTNNTNNKNNTNNTNFNNLMYKLSFINKALHKLDEEDFYSEFSLELYLEYNTQINILQNNIQKLLQHT
jgi:hypothetical protein